MKKLSPLLFYCAFTFWFSFSGFSQMSLTIEEAHEMAVERSPLQKQRLYLESAAHLNSRSYKSINYPQLMLNAQASYQSDVFSLPFQVPGTDAPIIPQEQYKLGIDFYQNIYDGGMSRSATQIQDAKLNSDMQGLEVSFQQIREIIN